MKRVGFIGMVVLVLASVSPCGAQQVVDKMVATVNAGVKTDLITYSDLMWQLALQPNTPLDNPNSADLNRALRLLIDQRLILQEAEKLPTIVPTPAEVTDERNELARNFRTQEEFQERLCSVGLTSERLDEIVEQRLKMEKYLDFRSRNFVVISEKGITHYYDQVYVPRFKERVPGRSVPIQAHIQDEIERTAIGAKIESDADAFLDTPRGRAEIVALSP